MSPKPPTFLKEELQGVKLFNPTTPLQGSSQAVQHSPSPRDRLASLQSLQKTRCELCLGSLLLGGKTNNCDLSIFLLARTAYVS